MGGWVGGWVNCLLLRWVGGSINSSLSLPSRFLSLSLPPLFLLVFNLPGTMKVAARLLTSVLSSTPQPCPLNHPLSGRTKIRLFPPACIPMRPASVFFGGGGGGGGWVGGWVEGEKAVGMRCYVWWVGGY